MSEAPLLATRGLLSPALSKGGAQLSIRRAVDALFWRWWLHLSERGDRTRQGRFYCRCFNGFAQVRRRWLGVETQKCVSSADGGLGGPHRSHAEEVSDGRGGLDVLIGPAILEEALERRAAVLHHGGGLQQRLARELGELLPWILLSEELVEALKI